MGLRSAGAGFIFSGWIILFLALNNVHSAQGYPCMVQNASSIFLTIPESFTPGRSFKTLDMIEGDASAKGNINLRLKEVNPYFGLDSATKSLILLRELDREALESKGETVQRLTLVCEYLDADQWRRIEVPVQIVVTDMNDNPPVFRNTPYKVTVNELTPVGSIIFKSINAVDEDSTGNLVIYSVVKGPYSDYVRFEDTLSGNLILMQPLDYETLKVFNVTVSAKDQGNPPLTATANVEVLVEDGDDQNPEFLQSSYTSVLPGDSPIGYELKIRPEPIKAVDKDKGIDSPVQYKIVEGANVFDIDKNTGQVFINGTVNHNVLYVLTIRATQVANPRRDTLTTLRISAEKPNRNAPKFLIKEYYQKVPENILVGTIILSVRATDPDPGHVLAYSLSSPETVPHFNLSINGDLRVIQNLDFERIKQFVMFVGVTDGALTDQARVTIDVLDVNDNNPEFDQIEYIFEVPIQAKTKGGVLGKLEVTDRDGNNVTLTLLNHEDAFAITGRELVVSDPGVLNKTEYKLSVVAEDSGIPPRKSFTSVIVRFPPVALPSTTISEEYFILAIVLGGLAGFLLLVVLCLVCYLGKTWQEEAGCGQGQRKPWRRKSPVGSIRTSILDDDTRGLTYKQSLPYHDIQAMSPSTSESEASSNDLHPSEHLTTFHNDSSVTTARISAWNSTNLSTPVTVANTITPDPGLSPKGIILSTGNNTRTFGAGLRKPKRLKWEDEEPSKKLSGFEFGEWQSVETLFPLQSDTERPEVTVYF